MEIRKLLYVSDPEKPDLAHIRSLMTLRQLGLEDILLLHPSSVENCENIGFDYGVRLEELICEGPALPKILDAVLQ